MRISSKTQLKSSSGIKRETYDEKSFGRTMTVGSVEDLDAGIVKRRFYVDVFFHNLAIRHRLTITFLLKIGSDSDSATGIRRENEEQK